MSLKVAFYTWLARVLDPRGAEHADRIIAKIEAVKARR